MKKKYISICFFLIFSIILIFIFANKKLSEYDRSYTENIEIVNSTIFNDNHYLKLVTNDVTPENEEDFSRKVIQMYLDNTFSGFQFSLNDDNYPKKVEVSVYLNHEDLKEGKELLQFDFSIPEQNPTEQQ